MKDIELTLKHGQQTAVVSPFGGSLRRYFLTTPEGEWNAVWGYEGGSGKRGGQGDVLIPFPGRVRGGKYAFEGVSHELERNDKDGPNAIHGFVRAENWETVSSTTSAATFRYELSSRPGYPFSLRIEVTYSLAADGLTTRFLITNTGTTPAPVGVGFHPYFCGDVDELADWAVTIPARQYLEMDGVLPTGRVKDVAGSKCDFRMGRVVGDTKYNDCVLHLNRDSEGFANASVRSPGSARRVSIRMDRSFDYVVIYTGDLIPAPDARRAFAIEPMTCGPDAFNCEGWGAVSLKPGASTEGRYVILAHDS